MKNKKRLLIIIIAAVLAVAIALIVIFKPFSKKEVKVFPVSELMMVDFYEDSGVMEGNVRSEGIQKIFVSDTQKVNEIYVQKGQHVEVGDALLSYDTTLTEIELERASLAVKKLELELNDTKVELARINALVPSSEVLIEPDNSWIHYDPVTTPYLIKGTGTEADPMYFIVNSTSLLKPSFFEEYMPEGAGSLYVVLLEREHDAVNGAITESFGLIISSNEEEGFSFKPFTAEIPADIEKYDQPEDPYYEHKGSDYSAAEISAMRVETESKIRDLSRQIQISSLEYEKKTKEASDNVVRASRSGTVKEVRDPESAYKNGEAVVEISDGGGYFVDIQISELDLEKIHAGDPVSVMSYMDGTNVEGTISKISDVPSQNSAMGGYGNVNVSYYPATIAISEDANLKEGDLVSVTREASSFDTSSFYIETMFVRQEKGESFVYAAGEDGRLEKRTVVTGKNMYGSYTQIKEGLSDTDLIAFPYGKNVKSGSKTEEAPVSELYNY